ncbi:MAG: DEAD/DEAH box helicase family protein [Chloroflexi bacterium]|nr:DEAD/DEAH box helicase family protein [Chloroflexota bacterium]
MIPKYSETDTRVKLIEPALYRRGWTEEHIRREENAGGIYKVRGKWKREPKFVDYVLRVKVGNNAERVAVALIEAKKNTLPPDHGLEQAKQYAEAGRLNVPFVYTSNGYLFVEYDATTGLTSRPRPMAEFPTPAELRRRYEIYKGFQLDDEAARPLLTPYTGGDSVRRYYQDAAIRAVLERIAAGGKRALLALATGSGKTRIVVYLLKRIADAGQLQRVLFVCDRTELRDQATNAFQNVFGNDAQPVDGRNPRKNARILIATYQTLGVDTEDDDASFLIKHYPENYFSHIIIDECHRSAWGKWSLVLTRNPDAVQIGLTATPRQLKVKPGAPGVELDSQITADNLRYFGEPVYEYDLSQGIKDGYLAACEIQKGRVNLDDTGLTLEEIIPLFPLDPITGRPVPPEAIREWYEKTSYEDQILLPDREVAMSYNLFLYLLKTGGPEQKTIIFCVNDSHAGHIASLMNNWYRQWCQKNNRKSCDHYAFKCTAASSGNDMLPDFRGSANDYFVATTVDLLTTGVDVPRVQNIAFFRYLKSPISFYQMVGRGTRIYEPDNKLVFRVYDYTNATQLFGEEFISDFAVKAELPVGDELDEAESGIEEVDEYAPIKRIEVVGFDVAISDAGRYIVTQVDGRDQPVTVEEYKQQVAAGLVAQAPDLRAFRQKWVEPDERQALLVRLPADGQSALLIRELENMTAYDLYDVLAELGYGMAPRTLQERADAFTYKHATWLNSMPAGAAETIRALAAQFARGGTEELENRYIWQTPAVRRAGGVQALRALGEPAEVLRDTKVRMFAA